MRSSRRTREARRCVRSTAVSFDAGCEALEGRTLLSGVLDPAFGSDGYVNTSFANADQALAVAVQPDGKIVVAGSSSTGNTYGRMSNFAVARYHPDGSPDASFGTNGKVETDFDGRDDGAEAVVILEDGSILAGGWSATASTFDYDFALARYLPDGSPDTTFGEGGTVRTDFGGRREDKIYDLALLPGGKVIAAGVGSNTLNQIGLARYNPDGTLDATFGTGGRVLSSPQNISSAYDVAVQPDGKIVTIGGALGLARFHANGTLDTSFGVGGGRNESLQSTRGLGVAVGSDGSIYAAATSDLYYSRETRLYKYTSAGARVTSFGGGGSGSTAGAVRIATGGFFATPLGLGIRQDKIYVAATSSGVADQSNGVWTVARLLPDGTFDPTFGTGGKTSLWPGTGARVHDLAFEADGDLILTGGLDANFHTARVQANASAGSITGVKFEDLDADGVQDADEPVYSKRLVYVDSNQNGRLDTATATYTSNVVTSIPDGLWWGAESALAVTGVGAVSDVNVRLRLTHARASDLDVFLVSPSGTVVELFTDVGGTGDHFTNTVLDDEAATSVTAGAAPFTGSFRPEGSLAALRGENFNGTWKLRAFDDQGGDGGAIQEWSLTFAGTVAEDEPAAMTDARGDYGFAGLAPGAYVVRDELLPGHVRTDPAGATAHAVDVVGGENSVANFASYRPGYDGAGQLDTTWDLDGFRSWQAPAPYLQMQMNAAVLQPDGKLLVAGNAGATLGDAIVARFLPHGALDTSFGPGGAGYVTTNAAPGEMDAAQAIALQPDGKIVIGGESYGANELGDYFVARYHEDGSPDYSFGNGLGYVTTDFQGFGDTIYAIALQPDGKIVATGTAAMGTTNIATVRYNEDGSLDTSFAQQGKAIVDYFNNGDSGADVAIDANGKIVVVGGSTPVGGQRQWVLLRYNPDGTFDTTFSGDGRQNTSFTGMHANAKAVHPMPDGTYLVGGTLDGAMAVGRYLDNGAPDPSFGDGGFTRLPSVWTDHPLIGYELAVQPDGKILFGGPHGQVLEIGFALARLLPDGRLDPDFGRDGLVLTPTPGRTGGTDIVLQPDGKIFVIGDGFQADIARYLNDLPGTPDPVELINGILTLTGSDADDVFSLSGDGESVTATHAGTGETVTFPGNAIQRIDIKGDDGDDTLEISGDVRDIMRLDLGRDHERINIDGAHFGFLPGEVSNTEYLHVSVNNSFDWEVLSMVPLELASLALYSGIMNVGNVNSTLVVGALLMGPGALLNLRTNQFRLRGGDEEGARQALRAVEGLIGASRNGGVERWIATGITSQEAASRPMMTLAAGLAGNDVLVKYTYNGDANLDGRVNADDYFRIDQGFLAQPSAPLFAQGDFNYDGKVNADDYFLIDQAFLGQGPVLTGSGGSSPLSSTAAPDHDDARDALRTARRRAGPDESLLRRRPAASRPRRR